MTILLAKCPFCGSNFMLLNTEKSDGSCVVCGKNRKYTESEIAEAEAIRDKLSEKYIGRLEKLYGDRDYAAMKEVVEEVANAGLSSWYAWFCVGWYDLHEGKTGPAFDDFKLAVMFLDEENFDEFYELTMDAVIGSMEEVAKEDRDWSTEDTDIVDFTGALYERFEHLCESGDFMTDLVLRLSTLSDSIESALMGGALIKEIMMLVLDYMSGNLFVPDQLEMLNNAKSAVDSLDSAMMERINDGSMSPNTVKIWGSGFSEFLGSLIDIEDRIMLEYSEDDAQTLCDYWAVNDYLGVFDVLQNAFEFHTGYILSNKHNKGILKKRDKALKDFEESFKRPLVEGLADEESDSVTEYDRICPDCGKYLLADEEGLIRCECGFKSRVVTDDIDDLPENLPEVIIMGRKAFEEKDPRMLNNIGEKISSMDPDCWYGAVFIAASCSLDHEIGETIMLMSQAVSGVDQSSAEEFSDYAVEIVGSALTGQVEDQEEFAGVFLPALFSEISESPAKDCNIPIRIIDRMLEGCFDDYRKAFSAIMVIGPVMTREFSYSTSMRRHREVCAKIVQLLDAIDGGCKTIKGDNSKLKGEVNDLISTDRDLIGYLAAGMDARIQSLGDEGIGFLSGYWSANLQTYGDLAESLTETISAAEEEPYSQKSKFIAKAKHGLDKYLDSYTAPRT